MKQNFGSICNVIDDTEYDDEVRMTNLSTWMVEENTVSRTHTNFKHLDNPQLSVEKASCLCRETLENYHTDYRIFKINLIKDTEI